MNEESSTAVKKRLTDAERLDKIQQKMAQLKVQEQAIKAREREKERKARTRRLIQNGALAEQYLHSEGMEPGEFEKVLKKVAAMLAAQQ